LPGSAAVPTIRGPQSGLAQRARRLIIVEFQRFYRIAVAGFGRRVLPVTTPRLATCHWPAVIERLEHLLGSRSVSLWLRDSVLRSFTDAQAEIGVPNLFVATWIEQRLAHVVAEAIHAESGLRPALRFVIDPSLFRERRAEQAEAERARVAVRAEGEPAAATAPVDAIAGVNPEFRLDTFVVGAGNRMAHGAAQSVAEQPGTLYNPLFVYGGCGLGKSHLLQGVAQALAEAHPGRRVLYVSCETFVNQFLAALRRKGMAEFRERFRRFDTLVIDDVHLLAGKDHTQDEFLHTFNAMSVAGRQVVLASDAPPQAIERLRTELVNRFVSGLVVRLDPPDFATRCRILQQKARKWQTALPEEAAAVLARAVRGSVRELEGALVRLVAHARLLGEPLSAGLAARVAGDVADERRPVGLPEIATEVAAAFGVGVAELHARRRTRRVTVPRHVAMWLARELTGHSLAEIGDYFGGRGHVSVLHAEKQVRERTAADDDFRLRIQAVRARLRPGE
jgi:chromosomal replication initiator protein